MSKFRYVEQQQLFEITTRVTDGTHLMRPDDAVTDIVLGCIGRAQSLYKLKIHAFVFMSNHYHMLVSPADAKHLTCFTRHLNSNTAREINRLRDRSGAFWGRRFKGIPVSMQADDQIERLDYVLKHGVKEGLVPRVRDWPGASSVPWLVGSGQLQGTWRDRTAAHNANRRVNFKELPGQFDIVYDIEMSPLPCWVQKAAKSWRAEVRGMVADIDQEAARTRETEAAMSGKSPEVVGVEAVLQGDPWNRTAKPTSKRAPCLLTRSAALRRRYRSRLRSIEIAYREASVAYRNGNAKAVFPQGVFRPMGSFVPWAERPVTAAPPLGQISVANRK
jgi:REP element-mobilizing transposase RayT